MVQEGDIAPDFTLKTAEGETVSLSYFLSSGRHVLLVFLRHLG